MEFDIYRKVLLMVGELHVRGCQRLRIAPGMSPSGMHWRCSITPASNISRQHGAMIVDWDTLAAHYSSASRAEYFGWHNAAHLTPSRLAARFMEEFPALVAAGRGSDWLYCGWYQEMLGITYPDLFPIAYEDDDPPEGAMATVGGRSGILLPLPPPGECTQARMGN
ncbi:hypothetical protein HGA89_03010 [bacterium]|nr:hypothetical protein [bacterium]